jgi:hypothetical protein
MKRSGTPVHPHHGATGTMVTTTIARTRTAGTTASTPTPAPLPVPSRHATTTWAPTHAPVLLPAPGRPTTTALAPTYAPALLPAPSRRATTACAPTHASEPLPVLGRRTTTARAPAHARVPLPPVPGRPTSTRPRTATITPGVRTRRLLPDHHRALHNGPSPLASKERAGPSTMKRASGMTQLFAHTQIAALSLRRHHQPSPLPRPFTDGRSSRPCAR